MANQKRFYVVLLNDPDGKNALGAYTRAEARIVQVANIGSRIVTAEQLAEMRARAHAREVVRAACEIAHDQSDPRLFRGSPSEFFARAARGVSHNEQAHKNHK